MMTPLITLAEPHSPAAEAYRTLRTNVQFMSLDRPLRTLLATSTRGDEGKTTTLANLAVTFANAGSRVVLVDCDLRRPSIHTLFGFDNTVGLTTAMLGEEPLKLRPTEVENLRVLTAGPPPPNPSELLGSQRMERIVEELKAECDVVFFDTPPVVAVTDAAVLARKVDGVLLVLGVGKTRREHAVRARDLLQRVGANLLGVVLTNAKLGGAFYRY